MSGNIATNESTASGLAPVILNTPDSTYPNGQSLSALATGLVKVTTGTGALSTAVAADLPAAGIGAGAHGATLIKSITTDAQGRVTAETDGVAGVDYAYPGRLGKLIASGISKTSLAKDAVMVDCGAFVSAERWVASGTWSTPATVARGGAVAYIQTTSGALDRRSAVPGTNQPFVLANQPFYGAVIAKLGVTPLATGQAAYLQLIDGGSSQNFAIGVDFANISQTKFGAEAYDGSAVGAQASTISIDANWHLFEVWYDGVSYWFSVDNETKIQLSTHLPTGASKLGARIQAVPNGVNMNFQANAWCFVVGSEA